MTFAMNHVRRSCRPEVHPIRKSHTCLKEALSEIILAVDLDIYNGPGYLNQMDLLSTQSHPINPTIKIRRRFILIKA